MRYAEKVREVLSPRERTIFDRLRTPQKIQDYLDSLPINFEMKGETYMSPSRTIAHKTAHCMEGALLAAAAIAYHGGKPLLMDLRSIPDDEDHVVALFQQNGYWGAISKTNHSILRYRDPIYKTVREIALSYAHEYAHYDGRKSLREASYPFSLAQYSPARWITADEELEWIVQELDDSPHFPVVPKKNIKLLRKAAEIEIDAHATEEWRAPRGFKRRTF